MAPFQKIIDTKYMVLKCTYFYDKQQQIHQAIKEDGGTAYKEWQKTRAHGLGSKHTHPTTSCQEQQKRKAWRSRWTRWYGKKKSPHTDPELLPLQAGQGSRGGYGETPVATPVTHDSETQQRQQKLDNILKEKKNE